MKRVKFHNDNNPRYIYVAQARHIRTGKWTGTKVGYSYSPDERANVIRAELAMHHGLRGITVEVFKSVEHEFAYEVEQLIHAALDPWASVLNEWYAIQPEAAWAVVRRTIRQAA